MRFRPALLAVALLGAAPAAAQIVINPIERLVVQPKRGPSSAQPGFQAGEYSGFSLAAPIAGAPGFQLSAPAFAKPVTTMCERGPTRLPLDWIGWKPDGPAFNCVFSGGAPEGAVLSLALGDDPSLRAGELVWGGMTIRFQPRPPAAGPPGAATAFVFSRDGKEIGGLDLGGGATPPTVFLPAKGSPDRDAMMVAALALAHFRDPARPG